MSCIVGAELLEKRAEFPVDYEPQPFLKRMTMQFGDAAEHDGQSLVTLRMRRDVFASLGRRRIGVLLTVVQEGPEDWLTVTFRAALDMPLLAWLKSLDGVVVLGPRLLRADATGRLRAMRQAYEASIEDAKACAREEKRWYESEDEAS